MILGYHVIISAYGFWLPNDPRGSWSDFVGAWELCRFGPATKTDDRRSLAARPHDRGLRQAAKQALRYPAVHFDGHQALTIARGFAIALGEGNYPCRACAILPEHVHLVLGRCDLLIERVVARLKAKATAQLNLEGRSPLASFADNRGRAPTPWAAKCWKRFLDCGPAVHRAVCYVERNPEKEGKRRQWWPFVVPWQPE